MIPFCCFQKRYLGLKKKKKKKKPKTKNPKAYKQLEFFPNPKTTKISKTNHKNKDQGFFYMGIE